MDKAKKIVSNILEDKKDSLQCCKNEINDLVERLSTKNMHKQHLEAEVEQLERTVKLIDNNILSATVGVCNKAGNGPYKDY